MADFDPDDLKSCIRDLHRCLSDRPNQVLSVILERLEQMDGRITKQARTNATVTKSLAMVVQQLQTLQAQQEGSLIASAALLADAHQRPVAKSQESPIRSIRTMAQDAQWHAAISKAEGDAARRDAGKVLQLRKAIVEAFGSRGGREVRYHAETAARLRLAGGDHQ